MKFVTVRDFRSRPKEIWDDLKVEHELVVTNNGKPIALMTPVTDRSLEDSLKQLRKIRAMQAVKKMRETSLKLGHNKMTLEQINSEIRKARKNK